MISYIFGCFDIFLLERFEFDAIEEAPSTMSIKIFDFEGPFSESESVGYAEVNFLKQTREQLADLWVPLEGKNARAAGCKIHLRVVLINTAESKNAEDYIQKVEKEVGRKASCFSLVHTCTCTLKSMHLHVRIHHLHV
jgi:hypothetical protein